jgi:tRNA 2-thiouridine synthesizing protein D
MKYTLKLLSSPTQNTSQQSAYHFAQACLQQGHDITQIFFYGDAVLTANAFISPAQDELNIQTLWQTLSTDFNIPLVVCIAAANRRGILSEQEAKRHNKASYNLAQGFELAGLGQFIESAVTTDRTVTFG